MPLGVGFAKEENSTHEEEDEDDDDVSEDFQSIFPS